MTRKRNRAEHSEKTDREPGFSRSRRWRVRRATKSSAVTEDVEQSRRGAPKRHRLLDRYGWYEQRPEGAWTTTRQAEALNLATSRRSSRHEGVVAGLNIVSGELEILDPFALYGDAISGINVCVIGDIGQG